MKNYSKAEALHIIAEAVKQYDASLKNYQFLIAFLHGSDVEYSIVGFKSYNFKHLTGLQSSLTAGSFYNRLTNHALSTSDFEFDAAGSAQLKLAVLPQLGSLFYGRSLRGIFNRSGIRIEADYVIGKTTGSFSVAFRTGDSWDYPVSLYNEDVRKLTNDTTKVLAVWRRKFGEKAFTENTYHAKEIDPDELLKRIQE